MVCERKPTTIEDLEHRAQKLDAEERNDTSDLVLRLVRHLRTTSGLREDALEERLRLALERAERAEAEVSRLQAVDKLWSIDKRIVDAVAAEREACARLVDVLVTVRGRTDAEAAPLIIAANAIRSRPTPATGGREYEEGVVVLRVPFEPNVPLIRESLEKHFGSADPPPSAPGEVCGRCRGGGRYHTMVSEHMGGEWKTCPDCHGTGKTSGTTGVDAHPSTRSVDTSRAADGPEEPRSPSGDSPAPSVEFGNEHPVDTWIRDHDRVPVTPNVRSSLFALLTRAREEGRRLGLEQAAKECVAYADAIDDADSEAEYAAGKCAARIQKLANGVEW